jgi:hypothetical protein
MSSTALTRLACGVSCMLGVVKLAGRPCASRRPCGAQSAAASTGGPLMRAWLRGTLCASTTWLRGMYAWETPKLARGAVRRVLACRHGHTAPCALAHQQAHGRAVHRVLASPIMRHATLACVHWLPFLS